ncbi:MAG: AbrB/MazE/SpoVT family DNA-binding domain-containing protein [Nitrospirota bacterium]
MSTTLSAKGQVTIPKKIRDVLRIHSGDMVDFLLDKGEVKLRVVKKGQAKAITGSLSKYVKIGYYDDEIREITKRKIAIETAKEDTEDTSD